MKLSIVIPLYNKEKYILRALNSIVSQKHVDYEVIVVDDGSTDAGPDLVQNFDLMGRQLILLRKKNGGASSARNLGIKSASSKYVVFLDADDELLPFALKSYRDMILGFPDCGAFGVGFVTKRHGVSLVNDYRDLVSRECKEINYLEGIAKGAAYLTSSTSCVKKSVFDEVGYFDETLIQREDPQMWIRIAVKYKIVYCPDIFVIYHQDDEGRICNTYLATEVFADSKLLLDLLNDKKLNSLDSEYAYQIIANNYLTQAFQNLRVRQWAVARNCMKLVKYEHIRSKANLILLYILMYSGLWLFFNALRRYRFLILSILNFKTSER